MVLGCYKDERLVWMLPVTMYPVTSSHSHFVTLIFVWRTDQRLREEKERLWLLGLWRKEWHTQTCLFQILLPWLLLVKPGFNPVWWNINFEKAWVKLCEGLTSLVLKKVRNVQRKRDFFWRNNGTILQCIPTTILIGASCPDGIPYGFADFFFCFCFCFFLFFFFRRHLLCPFVVKKTTDWAEILHNHTYGHASGWGKKYFRCAHFPLSYVSKITQKNFRNS